MRGPRPTTWYNGARAGCCAPSRPSVWKPRRSAVLSPQVGRGAESCVNHARPPSLPGLRTTRPAPRNAHHVGRDHADDQAAHPQANLPGRTAGAPAGPARASGLTDSPASGPSFLPNHWCRRRDPRFCHRAGCGPTERASTTRSQSSRRHSGSIGRLPRAQLPRSKGRHAWTWNSSVGSAPPRWAVRAAYTSALSGNCRVHPAPRGPGAGHPSGRVKFREWCAVGGGPYLFVLSGLALLAGTWR